jgi:predicted Zn-dependent protease
MPSTGKNSVARTLCRLLGVLLAVALMGRTALADQGPSYLRDAEIETILRTFYTPIFRAAGLDPAAVHIYIVNDPTLNSFVAGGQNVFINTGTIIRSETPNQLIGITAHETGHIAGGHLIRSEEALRDASIKSIIAMVVGAAAMAMAKGGGGASSQPGQDPGLRSFLQFSIAQEAQADQAGLRFLDRTHQSARGLLQFFQILQQQELLSGMKEVPYLRTHPLTSQRIEYIGEHVKQSPYSDTPDPPEWVELHKRMKAKLLGFLSPPGNVVRDYPLTDNSVAARYARAISYYRIPDLKPALQLIDGLIKQEPRNPYFHELKGQMLFENGRVREAVGPYQEAVRLAPDTALLRVELAQVELETEDPALNRDALAQLLSADRYENRNPDTWRFLAIAYGRNGDLGNSALALAEQAMAEGDRPMARQQAERAIKLLPAGSPGRLRAEDIKIEAQRKEPR